MILLIFYLPLQFLLNVSAAEIAVHIPNQKLYEHVIVQRVLAGDTLELVGGQQVRLLGIDAPETDDPLRIAQEAGVASLHPKWYGSFAEKTTQLVKTLEGQAVQITFDPETSYLNYQDRWGQLLGYAKVQIEEHGNDSLSESIALSSFKDAKFSQNPDGTRSLLINETLLSIGYAKVDTFYPFGRQEQFEQLSSEAKASKLGIWEKQI